MLHVALITIKIENTMQNIMETTGSLLELAEFVEQLVHTETFKSAKPGDDLKPIATTAGLAIPAMLSSAHLTAVHPVAADKKGSEIRVYLGGHDHHSTVAAKPSRHCIRLCIWWGVCFNVCWVCDDNSCYLDIRRAN